jgi:PAS domain-containing protein
MPLGLVQTIPGRNPYVRAVVCAIQPSYGTSILGFLVLGLNGRRPWNDAYRDFIRLLTDRINTCTAHVVLPREQREAQAATEEAALRHSSLTKQLLLRTQEAERSEANFMRIAAFAAFGMFVLKSDGSPTYLNEAFYDLTGVKKSDIEFQFKENFWSKTIHPHDLEHVRESWAKMTRDRQPIVFEYRGIKPWSAIDKATNTEMMGDFWIRAMAFPEVDTTDDNVVGMQGWLENISLQKYTERMQQNKLEQALEHKRQSEAFIDMTSHEIRNVRGSVRILKEVLTFISR